MKLTFPPGAGLPGYATVAREEPTAQCERVLGYCASRSDHVKSNLLVTSVVVLNPGSLDERTDSWCGVGAGTLTVAFSQGSTRPACQPFGHCPCVRAHPRREEDSWRPSSRAGCVSSKHGYTLRIWEKDRVRDLHF